MKIIKNKKHTIKKNQQYKKQKVNPRIILQKTKKHKTIPIIIVKCITTDSKLEKKEGHFFDNKEYKKIINYDCDVYGIDENGDKICLAKLRKNVIPQEVCIKAYQALEKQAQKLNDNRGAAAGLIDKRHLPKYVKEITQRDKFRAYYIDNNGIQRKGHISNRVRSNIIGYYDMPDRNILKRDGKAPKCRQTAFTRDEVEKWESACPIFKLGDKQFKKLMPKEHRIQLKQCRKTPKYQILDTAFSTVTVNYNYRSALHKDAGDLDEGFGNLMVLEKNKCILLDNNEDKIKSKNKQAYDYKGGFLGFPKYGIAIDARQGDFLAMNVHEWHANCKMICCCDKGVKCKNKDHFGRLSLVCYLRKNMIQCSK